MSAYSTDGWSDFFVAASGASGALAGLVFVGISINLSQIIALPGLSSRAAQTLASLANALAITLVLLSPTESRVAIGLEVLLIGLAGWAAVYGFAQRATRGNDGRAHRGSTMLLAQVATVPFVVSGASVLVEFGGGLYWMQAGVILAVLASLVNGWVLLVEILR